MKDFFNVKELAEYLSLSEQTIRKLIKEGRIGYHRIREKRILISVEQVNKFIKDCTVEAKEK